MRSFLRYSSDFSWEKVFKFFYEVVASFLFTVSMFGLCITIDDNFVLLNTIATKMHAYYLSIYI